VLVLQSCDAAALAGIWRPKPLAAHMAHGGPPTVPHLPWLCQSRSSDQSALLPSQHRDPLNPANRRMRTRMSGGVGGAQPRGCPLSRLSVKKG